VSYTFFCKIIYILLIFNYSKKFSKIIFGELRWIYKIFLVAIVENFFWPIISALCDFWIRGYDGILQWRKIQAIKFYAFKSWCDNIFQKMNQFLTSQGYGLQYTIGKLNVRSILTKNIWVLRRAYFSPANCW
jgi:hypothetical protein